MPLCRNYKGSGIGCRYEERCQYLHITPSKSTEGKPWLKSSEEDRWYRRPCKFYNNGYCPWGESCTYIHIVRQRQVPHSNNGDLLEKKAQIREKVFPSGTSIATSGKKATFSDRTQKQPHGKIEDLIFQNGDLLEKKAPIRAKVFASGISVATSGPKKTSSDGTQKQPHGKFEETSRNKLKEHFYTTRLKPSINWQTKEQIKKYGFVNRCAKRKNRSPSAEIKLRNRSRNEETNVSAKEKISPVKKTKVSDKAKIPPVKKAKTSDNVKQSSVNIDDELVKSLSMNEEKLKKEVKDIDSLAILARNHLLSVLLLSVDNTTKDKILLDSVENSTKEDTNSLDADFHGFSECARMANDLTKVEIKTHIINMENKYDDNCSEFAQYYQVIEQKEKVHQSLLVSENNNSKFANDFNLEADHVVSKHSTDISTHPMKIFQMQVDSPKTGRTKCDDFSSVSPVTCSKCHAEYPAFVISLTQNLEGGAGWRCRDCTECAACRRDDCSSRMSSLPLMMCSICGDHYHVEEGINDSCSTFFCQACGDFADYLLQEQ